MDFLVGNGLLGFQSKVCVYCFSLFFFFCFFMLLFVSFATGVLFCFSTVKVVCFLHFEHGHVDL
jgi:hypothetical protein